MENIGEEFRKILNDLEENLKDNPDLDYIKSEFNNLAMVFFTEIDSLKKLYEQRIETMLDRQSYFDEKISNLEELTKIIEKEMPSEEDDIMLIEDIDDDELEEKFDENGEEFEKIDEEFEEISNEEIDDDSEECEIQCPYCGEVFILLTDEIEKEVNCPFCSNTMELDLKELED